MAEYFECPSCKRKSAEVVRMADGNEKMVCSTCGQQAPRCYAQMWDPNNPKCRGGADPTHWEGGTHVRPKCSFESRCSAAQDKRQKEQLVPVMNTLSKPYQNVEVRPQTLTTPTATPVQPPQSMVVAPQRPAGTVSVRMTQAPPPVQQQPRVVQQMAPQQQQRYVQHPQAAQIHYQQAVAPMPMAWVPPEMAAQPTYVPQNYPAPGMQVPSPLAVPEPYNGNVARMVLITGARTGLKFMLLGMANALDYVSWSPYPVPQPPQPPGPTGQ